MTVWQEFRLALRLLRRDSRAGELRLLGAAIVIAVASLTTVGFFTDRVQQALQRQSNQLLGADLTIVSDRPLTAEFEQAAASRGLAVTRGVGFPSMVVKGEENLLADIKAVGAGYPLRGELRIADVQFAPDRAASSVPPAGTAWADERLLTRLGVEIGTRIGVGATHLQVAALVTQEPESVIGFLNSLPRLIMNESDIAATGLIRTGSRVRYRLYIAGDDAAVDDYRNWAQPRLGAGQRVEGIRDARPEIRSALERAERFLGLAALVSVVLAAVAVALAARRFLVRHLDGCAVMRCLGARQVTILRLYLMHFAVLGLLAGAIGCAVGYAAQYALAGWLGTLVTVALPAPGWLPVWQGLTAGVLLLLAFALPPLSALAQVSTMRVLRRDFGVPRGFGALGYLLGLALICSLVLWKAHDLRLGLYVLGGFLSAGLASGLVVVAVLRVLSRLRSGGGISWRYGIANLRRHALATVVQVVALGIGIMALLTLTLIRGDLLQSWKGTLRPDSPNRFVINIQSDQVQPLTAFFTAHAMAPPVLFPMVRGRLIAINERPVSPADFVDDRARRLVDREFNLSSALRPPAGNQLTAGRWWRKDDPADQLSVEDGIAATLGLKIGDRLTYDVAGTRFTAAITSLRKVDWDSFNVNFFVVTPPALLQGHPVSHITSFYSPPGQVATLNALVREFPNVVMIDVAQVMAQVQKMMDQVSSAVQFVFLFTLAAGLAVLYAAILSTGDEREYEAAVMRTLGASRRQIAAAQLAEFALIGALAGLLAAGGASALGYVLALKVLNVPYAGSVWVWLVGAACGAFGVAIAGMLGTRRVLAAPPLQSLRRAA
jgi:putative ABC transport system permease protein